MATMEEAVGAMLRRMCDAYSAGPLPIDPNWRQVKYDKAACHPSGLASGSRTRSPRAFVEAVRGIWLAEGYLRDLQKAWLEDDALDDLSYANNFDLWRESNGIQERIARVSLLRLMEGDPDPVRKSDVDAFVADLRSHTQHFVAVAPVSGVSVEGPPLRLSPEVAIRCLSPTEHEFLVNSTAFNVDQRAFGQWWRFPTVIETRLPVDYHRHLETRLSDAAELVHAARLALSVSTDTNVHTPGLYGSLETAFPVLMNRSEPSAMPVAQHHPWSRPLDDAARQRAILMWQGLPDADGALRVALGRLGFLTDRQEPVDALVDAWVALEAMFSGRGVRSELRYRLSFRIASFVRDTPPERQEVFQSLYDSYDMRSRLVHGDKRQPRQSDLEQTLARTVSIARECAFRLVTSDRAVNPDDLDATPFLV